MASNNTGYDPHVNIKMELDEPSNTLSFLMSNVGDVFDGDGGVSGLLEDDGLGLGSSLTLYKSEPADQEDIQDPVFSALIVPQIAEDLESAADEPVSSSEAEDDEDGSSSDAPDSGMP